MPITKKQMQIMAFPFTDFDALIADGAIRSGKTSFMTLAFVDDAMRRYDGQRFGICGKTVDSTVKNIIVPYLGLAYAREKYTLAWHRSDKTMIVSDGVHSNVFEVFGGKDEASFMLIQGRTLAGVLLDEVALQPQSFVEQAMARCSVDGSKLWFNCNPDSPEHWFYKDWILKAREKNALHLHFLLEDNPSLSEKIIARYKSLYSGVFYRRYILGEWCVAEGLVYGFFDRARHVTDDLPKSGRYYISVDYGTHNPTSMGLWCVKDGVATRIREYYHSGRETGVEKTPEEYYKALVDLAGPLPVEQVVIDPAAAEFIATVRRHGRFSVRKAKNDVLAGIALTSTLIQNGFIKIGSSCKDCIREFGLYSWDEKSETDKVLKVNDHAMDDVRYFAYTILRRDGRVRDFLKGYLDDVEEAEEMDG